MVGVGMRDSNDRHQWEHTMLFPNQLHVTQLPITTHFTSFTQVLPRSP
jgi:hypothetical protein